MGYSLGWIPLYISWNEASVAKDNNNHDEENGTSDKSVDDDQITEQWTMQMPMQGEFIWYC